MNTQITRNDIQDALAEIDYDPEKCTESLSLDDDVFHDLALIAHDCDITVNAVVNAFLRLAVNKHEELPNIPGVGTAPYMDDNT